MLRLLLAAIYTAPIYGAGHDHGDYRFSGVEFPSSDCSGAPVDMWNYPSFPFDEASATCESDGSSSSYRTWCDVSGEQPRSPLIIFPDVGDCSGTGAEWADAADGSCVDVGDGTSYRWYCGEYVDEFLSGADSS